MNEKRITIRPRPTRQDFAAMLEMTERGEILLITRYGQPGPEVVLMSYEHYRRLRPQEESETS